MYWQMSALAIMAAIDVYERAWHEASTDTGRAFYAGYIEALRGMLDSLQQSKGGPS